MCAGNFCIPLVWHGDLLEEEKMNLIQNNESINMIVSRDRIFCGTAGRR